MGRFNKPIQYWTDKDIEDYYEFAGFFLTGYFKNLFNFQGLRGAQILTRAIEIGTLASYFNKNVKKWMQARLGKTGYKIASAVTIANVLTPNQDYWRKLGTKFNELYRGIRNAFSGKNTKEQNKKLDQQLKRSAGFGLSFLGQGASGQDIANLLITGLMYKQMLSGPGEPFPQDMVLTTPPPGMEPAFTPEGELITEAAPGTAPTGAPSTAMEQAPQEVTMQEPIPDELLTQVQELTQADLKQIQPGKKSKYVVIIRRLLLDLKYDSGSLTSNVYDDKLKKAIAKFQADTGLPANGLFDNITRQMLIQLWAVKRQYGYEKFKEVQQRIKQYIQTQGQIMFPTHNVQGLPGYQPPKPTGGFLQQLTQDRTKLLLIGGGIGLFALLLLALGEGRKEVVYAYPDHPKPEYRTTKKTK